MAVAGCGAKPSDEQQIRSTVTAFYDAMAKQDAEGICAQLEDGAKQEQAALGGSCEKGVVDWREVPNVKVVNVDLNDAKTKAIAQVTTGFGPDALGLVREDGEWRIAEPPDDKGL